MTNEMYIDRHDVVQILEEVFPVVIMDQAMMIQEVNDSFCQLVKCEKEKLVGHSIDRVQIKIIDEGAEDRYLSPSLFAEENYIKEEVEYIDHHGNVFWAVITMMKLADSKGTPYYIVLFNEHLKSAMVKHLPIHPLQYLQTLERAVNESNAIIVTDEKGIILSVNKRYMELSQFPLGELIGRSPSVVKSGYQPPDFYERMWDTILSGEIWTGELRNKAKDGSMYWVHSTTVPILNQEGKPIMFIAIQTDITRRINMEKALQDTLQHDFDKTVRNLYNVVFKFKRVDGGIVFTLLEGKLVRKLNLSLGKMTMEQIKERHSVADAKQIQYHFNLALDGQQTNYEIELNGYALLVYLSPIFEGDEVKEVVGTIIDISHRKKAEELAKQMAYYDFLTQLPNRRYLQEKAQQYIFDHEMEGHSFALMFIDIDRFKSINDSLGHAAGDQFLIQLAQRLKDAVRQTDLVARLGGDEFIVLLPRVSKEEAEAQAQQIVEHLSKPFNHRNLDMYIRASIGISMFPRDGIDYDTILGSADIAMYENKKSPKAAYQFFNQTLRQNIINQTLLEMDLRQAIERDQFELFYQAKYDLKSKQLVGVEALLRWYHPVKGYISPGEFIGLAEDTGAIIPIGKWVLRTALSQLKSWLAAGYPPMTMAVNISIAQFKDPNFIADIQDTIEDLAIDPGLVNLEVTESMMMEKKYSDMKLQALRDLGVEISIDDFGTGYSSLSYLSHYPVTHLKVDRSFIQDLSPSNRAIVQTIISLAQALQLQVVAEGVETVEQEAFLNGAGCHQVQGFFYARPQPARELEATVLKKEINQ